MAATKDREELVEMARALDNALPLGESMDRIRVVLGIDQILAAQDLDREWVSIPEWAPPKAENTDDYGVYVRSLTGRERAAWQEASLKGQGKNATVNFQATTVKLVVFATVTESGDRVFTESNASDLQKKNSKVLERIADVAMRLSGIGDAEMQEVSGNSTGTQDGDSLTS